MKIFNCGIAVFSAIFGFAAELVFAACGWISAISIAVRRRIPALGIAVIAVILMVGGAESALASNHPPSGDRTTIADLDEYDPDAAAPATRARLGGSPLVFPEPDDTVTRLELGAIDPKPSLVPILRNIRKSFSTVDWQYEDSNGKPQVIVQLGNLFGYAALGIWVYGDISAVGNFEYQPLADGVVVSPDASDGAGTATYIIEGDFVYKDVRFYPDGHLEANFDDGSIRGKISADGDFANDNFGSGAQLPDGNGEFRNVAANDDLTIELLGRITPTGLNGYIDEQINVVTASGFFNEFRTGRQRRSGFEGRFHDHIFYRRARSTPIELSGLIWLQDGGRNPLNGGFIGKQRGPLPAPSDSMKTASLHSYDFKQAYPTPGQTRAGGGNDEKFSTRQVLSISGSRYDDVIENKPQVLVQMLEHAYLGVWMKGDVSAVGNFEYATFSDRAVTPPARSDGVGRATYDIEGDAVYNDVRFYPDGYLNADFNQGTLNGLISVYGDESEDDFGVAEANLPDGVGSDAVLRIGIRNGEIKYGQRDDSGFKADAVIHTAEGFFSGLEEDSHYSEAVKGRFHDVTSYNPSVAPAELSGTLKLLDSDNSEKTLIVGGFLGKKE